MRSFFIAIITMVLMTGSAAFAKNLEQGTLSVGGNGTLGFQRISYENENDNDKELNLDLTIGYFFVDNIQLTLSLLYSNEEYSGIESSMVGFGGGIKFHIPVNNDINYYITGMYGVLSGETERGSGDDLEMDLDMLSFGIGMQYFLAENIAVDIGFDYNMIDTNYSMSGYSKSPTYESDRMGVSVGFDLYF